MFSSVFTLALLSTTAVGLIHEQRQATDAPQFTAAADQLISQYIPSSILTELESRVSSAASAANVAGEPLSLIYDAFLAMSMPSWFISAVPTSWSSQVAALQSDVNALRPTASPGGTLVPIVIAVTTTDSSGKTITTSETSSATSVTGTTVTSTEASGQTTTTSGVVISGGSVYSSLTTQVIGGVTSVFSAAVTGVTSIAGQVSSGIDTAASKVSTAATGASGIVSSAVSKVSSVASGASSSVSSATSSAGGAGVPTAVSGAAAGVIGMVGLMIAL